MEFIFYYYIHRIKILIYVRLSKARYLLYIQVFLGVLKAMNLVAYLMVEHLNVIWVIMVKANFNIQGAVRGLHTALPHRQDEKCGGIAGQCRHIQLVFIQSIGNPASRLLN